MSEAERVLAAGQPEDLFGNLPQPASLARAELTRQYRRLSLVLHPDNKLTGNEDAFKRLAELRQAALEAIDAGRYGRREHVGEVLITTRRHAYTVDRIVTKGELSTIFHAIYPDEDGTRHALLKVVRDPKNGPQLAHEAQVLKALLKGEQEMADTLAPYLPRYCESFAYRRDGKSRQATAFMAVDGLATLEMVRQAYPNGVHPKDSAWMLRRLLLALGLAHGLGWAHGQVHTRHILIHPQEHGLVLWDWTKATSVDRDSRGEDIKMALGAVEAITAMRLAPERLKRFMAGCQQYPHRLPDAITLRDEYTELIEDMWGKRVFRPFAMPKAAA